jgi:hypothetical protein
MANVKPGRPAADDFAPYFARYIDLVTDDSVLDVLIRQHAEFMALLAPVSEEKSLQRYAPGKWSIRALLNHVSDCERTFSYRAFWFARGFNDALPSIEQDVAASHAEADAIAWPAHVAEFDRVRLATISLFENMPAVGWSQKGISAGKPISVHALAYLIAGHAKHHLIVLREKYL